MALVWWQHWFFCCRFSHVIWSILRLLNCFYTHVPTFFEIIWTFSWSYLEIPGLLELLQICRLRLILRGGLFNLFVLHHQLPFQTLQLPLKPKVGANHRPLTQNEWIWLVITPSLIFHQKSDDCTSRSWNSSRTVNQHTAPLQSFIYTSVGIAPYFCNIGTLDIKYTICLLLRKILPCELCPRSQDNWCSIQRPQSAQIWFPWLKGYLCLRLRYNLLAKELPYRCWGLHPKRCSWVNNRLVMS